MDRLKSILVAVDFSPCSADAFRQAARLANRARGTLSAIHFVDVSAYLPYVDPFVPAGLPWPQLDELVPLARQRWTTFVPDSPAKAAVRLDVRIANPRDGILERAYRDNSDLLVIGAHSTHDQCRGIGATAGACVQRAAMKVLVVREGQPGPFKSIVACVDFSDASRVALEQAIRLAAEDNAALHILHVYSDPWRGLDKPAEVQVTMPDFNDRFQRAVEDRLRSFCQPFEHEMNAPKAEYHARLSPNHAEGIIAFIQTTGCDLAVLGTRGTWNARDFFWGSTAERVVRECPCSVLAIKPPGFQQIEPQPTAAASAPVGRQAIRAATQRPAPVSAA